MNCWEYMRCGREEGGIKSKELSPAPPPFAVLFCCNKDKVGYSGPAPNEKFVH